MRVCEIVPIGEIKPYENNPRRNDGAVDAVAASIKNFDFNQPIVVDKNGVIIVGHTRYKAAQKLGMTEVPIIRADDLTEEQAKAYRLADNKTAELAEWDFEKLDEELAQLDLDMSEFGFEEIDGAEWFNREEKEGRRKEEGNEEYNEFLDKFEAPKTTDDCYTPENIYNVIAEWVEKEYGVKKEAFVRPFFPGGDYLRHKYPKNCAVVDNPPFSILAQIIDFYVDNGIKFFLFAPGLVALNYTTREGVCALCAYASITYENGAKVATSFLTNMEDVNVIARATADLREAIDEANEENERAMHKQMPKYEYPIEVLTAARFGWLAKYGQGMSILRDECIMIRELDAMKGLGKGIYGNALLLSEKVAAERILAEKAAAEKAAAEKANAMVWQLSDREREIVKSLGKGGR